MSSILLVLARPSDSARLLAAWRDDASLAVCGVAHDLAQARTALARRVPDLLVADLRLPDGSLPDLLGELRPGRSHVLALAASVHDPHLLRALRAGADACLPARTDAETLRIAAHRMLAGESPLDPDVARRLLAMVEALADGPLAPPPGTATVACETETALLRCAAAGLRVPEIARRLGLPPAAVGRLARAVHRRLHARARRPAPLSPAVAGCR